MSPERRKYLLAIADQNYALELNALRFAEDEVEYRKAKVKEVLQYIADLQAEAKA